MNAMLKKFIIQLFVLSKNPVFMKTVHTLSKTLNDIRSKSSSTGEASSILLKYLT